MTQRICTLNECEQPVKKGGLCYGHYMKRWRYGDPRFQQTFEHDDIAGRRFGQLVALRREDGRWRCLCDCGSETVVRIGDLNRGTTNTCGDRPRHYRREQAGSSAAHSRVRTDRGPARDYACVDCGETAAHWSYNHEDPDELPAISGPYSLSPDFYEARCVPCHKRFDLDYLRRTA